MVPLPLASQERSKVKGIELLELYPDVGFLQYLTFMTLHPKVLQQTGMG